MTGSLDLLLYAITEKRYSRGRPLAEMMEPCLKGGASLIQLRDKKATTRELVDEALELRGLTRAYSVPLIINDRVDVALASSADGVHLGKDDMDPSTARKLLGPGKIIGMTVRNVDEARDAERQGVDYIAAGSIYESETKKAEIIGLEGLRDILNSTSLPVVAIGGIRPENLNEIFDMGASGVALAKELLESEDIEEKVRSIRVLIEELIPEMARRRK